MPRPTVRTHPLEVTDTGSLTEFLYDDGVTDETLLCAAHGGRVEPGTAEQAIELAVKLPAAACWACLGFDEIDEEFDLYHPASSSFDPAEYPLLAEIADRGFETVISLHGLADDRVLVGGGVDIETKRLVRDRLDEAVTPPVEVVTEGEYAGVSPDNFVNWLSTDGGLQLEQGRTARAEEAAAVGVVLEDLVLTGRL